MSDSYCPLVGREEWIGADSDADWLRPRKRHARVMEVVAKAFAAVEDFPLEDRLREQAEKWENETGHLSSPTQRIIHPSYQAILGIGLEHREETLRFLLRDLRENRRAWFWALSYLAQDNPIKSSDAGKMDKMIGAWMSWGKEKGLL
jgi:hypothetical protein